MRYATANLAADRLNNVFALYDEILKGRPKRRSREPLMHVDDLRFGQANDEINTNSALLGCITANSLKALAVIWGGIS
jgi:hypothetical protein